MIVGICLFCLVLGVFVGTILGLNTALKAHRDKIKKGEPMEFEGKVYVAVECEVLLPKEDA